jgi:hypothetical protein
MFSSQASVLVCVAPRERRKKKGVYSILYTGTCSRWTSRGATSRARSRPRHSWILYKMEEVVCNTLP